MCSWVGVRVVAFSVTGRRTHTHTHCSTQSCIRLNGETNPVTVSGNVSALTLTHNLDFDETQLLRVQNCVVGFFFAFSVFLFLFVLILSKSGMWFTSLGFLINTRPEPHPLKLCVAFGLRGDSWSDILSQFSPQTFSSFHYLPQWHRSAT